MVEKKTAAKKAPAKPPAKPADTQTTERSVRAHEIVLSPSIQSAVAIQAWGKYAGDVDLQGLVEDSRKQIKKVQDGDMKSVEAMLFGQAKTLETIFTSLARRAASNDGLKQFQVNLTLALKAQAQCRATLEALAEIKNPMPYIKQANIAHGPQQVNNGAIPEQYAQAHASAGDFQTTPNKLLEADHEQRMVIGAPGTASRVNQAVEAVEAVHRT